MGSCEVYSGPLINGPTGKYFWITQQCAECLSGGSANLQGEYGIQGEQTRDGSAHYAGPFTVWHDNENEAAQNTCCKIGLNPYAPLAACEIGRQDSWGWGSGGTFADGDIITVSTVLVACPP